MPFLTAEQLDTLNENSQGSSSYVNLSKLPLDKECRFRFFGSAILGWQGWVKDPETGNNKPIRWERKPDELPPNIEPDRQGNINLTFFVAGLVWDYTNDRFGIMQVTQKSVLERIDKLERDEDYGEITGYDIKITRRMKGDFTNYELAPTPPKPPAKSIQAAYEDLYCNLAALYDGGDPFKDSDAA